MIPIDQVRDAAVSYVESHAVDLGRYIVQAVAIWIRNRRHAERVIQEAHDFWHKNVLAGVPPEPEFDHPATLPMFKRLYPGTNGATVEADEMLLHWAKVAEDAAKKASEYDTVAETAKNHLLAFMGDAAVLKLDGNRVFRRKLIQKKPYTVEASSYIDARFGTTKE